MKKCFRNIKTNYTKAREQVSKDFIMRQWKGLHEYYSMETQILFSFQKKVEIEFGLVLKCIREEKSP